jgi:hypothetical protein
MKPFKVVMEKSILPPYPHPHFLPRLASNSWAQVTILSQPPK